MALEEEDILINNTELYRKEVTDEGYQSPLRLAFDRIASPGRLQVPDVPVSDDERHGYLESLRMRLPTDELGRTSDTAALTYLLKENEQNLEQAVLIGQSLLNEKKNLQDGIDSLNENVRETEVEVAQLRHRLSLMTGRLAIYENDQDDRLTECPQSLKVDVLRRNIAILEDENVQLKRESATCAHDLKTKEELLAQQKRYLNASRHDCTRLVTELRKKSAILEQLLEQIALLKKQSSNLHEKIRKQAIENETLKISVDEMNEAREDLILELANSESRYKSVLCDLQVVTEELRQHVHCRPRADGECDDDGTLDAPGVLTGFAGQTNPNSLAAELSTLSQTNESEKISGDEWEPNTMDIGTQKSLPHGPMLCEACRGKKTTLRPIISRLLWISFACLVVVGPLRWVVSFLFG